MKYIITIAVILYVTYQYYIKRTANDDIDTFNDIRAEVQE